MSVDTRPVRPWTWISRETLVALGAVCAVEAALLGAYLRLSPGRVTEWRYLLYPFVWLNAAGLVLVWVDPPAVESRRTALAGAVGVAYFLVLAVVDGTVALSQGTGAGLTVHWSLPPGWGPMVVADLGPLRIAPVPYRTVGYAAIATLVYAALAEASSRAVGGLVGLFSCVSCTLPVVAALLSGTVGGTGAAVATSWSYDLSTAVFLVTVAVLSRGTGTGSGSGGPE